MYQCEGIVVACKDPSERSMDGMHLYLGHPKVAHKTCILVKFYFLRKNMQMNTYLKNKVTIFMA